MPIKILIFIITITFFTACSDKQNPHATPQDTLHEQSLMQTKKATLLNKDKKVVAYVVATYLNQVENALVKTEKNDTEVFLVGIYEGEKSTSNLLKNIDFKIDGKEVERYVSLDKNSKVLKLIPSGNPWMQYYLLYAPSVLSRSISVSISSSDEKEVTFNFPKDNL